MEIVQQIIDMLQEQEEETEKEWRKIQRKLKKHCDGRGYCHRAGNHVAWELVMAKGVKAMWDKAKVAPMSWRILKSFMDWMVGKEGKIWEDRKQICVRCVGEREGKKGMIGHWESLGKGRAEVIHEVKITPGHMEVHEATWKSEPTATREIMEMAGWVCYGPEGGYGGHKDMRGEGG